MGKQSGISLIEMVVGMVVFAIAMVVILSFLLPQARQSLEPMYQIRATELAQSMLNEITAKAFDENSDRAGGFVRCSQGSAASCTSPTALGPDSGEGRNQFDDVDDYHGLTQLADSRNNSLAGIYQGYQLQVSVFYDEDLNGLADNSIGNAKLIRVDVQTPSNEVISFATYRSNY